MEVALQVRGSGLEDTLIKVGSRAMIRLILLTAFFIWLLPKLGNSTSASRTVLVSLRHSFFTMTDYS